MHRRGETKDRHSNIYSKVYGARKLLRDVDDRFAVANHGEQ